MLSRQDRCLSKCNLAPKSSFYLNQSFSHQLGYMYMKVDLNNEEVVRGDQHMVTLWYVMDMQFMETYGNGFLLELFSVVCKKSILEIKLNFLLSKYASSLLFFL